MPFIEDDRQNILEQRHIEQAGFDSDPTAKEIALAMFRTENSIGSLISGELPVGRFDENYNPWADLTDNERVDSLFVENAMTANNREDLERIRRQSARERKDREIIANGGAMSFALGFGIGGVGDPINLIPVGGAAYKTYKTGNSILKSGLITGSVASSSTALQESALHATQIERTFGESAVNMSAAFLLGGALGSGIEGLKRFGVTPESLKEIEYSMNPEEKISQGVDSVGAARVAYDPQIKGEKLRKVLKATAFDPATRTLTSDNPFTRNASNRLIENVYTMDQFSGAAVESLAKAYDGKYAVALEDHLSQWKSLRKETGISRKAFSEWVSKEIRNPDPNSPPQIKAAAAKWDGEVYSPIKKQAIEAKLLPEDVEPKTAINYLNRVWNGTKISADLPKFVDITSKWLKDQEVKLDGKSIDENEYEYVAQQIAQRIMGTPDGRLPYDWKLGEGSSSFGISGTKLKGPLQERVFDIPDKLVEEFLENDIELVAGRYYKQLAPDIELAKAFDGDVGMESQLSDIQSWWTDKIKTAKTPKTAAKYKKQMDKDIRDLSAMRDRIRGVYGLPDDFDNVFTRTARTARDLNYLRFMGGVVAASVPDVARIFMAEGFANTFKFGLKPLISNVKSFKVAAAEGKRYNGALSALFGGRGELIADIADYTRGGTLLERGVRGATEKFGKINLMDYWTAGVKQVHAVTMQTTIFDKLSKGQYDKRLFRLGIGEDEAKRMFEQVKKYGKKEGGVWVTGAKNWDNPELERMWGAAMRKESDRVIVVPGQEKPLFMSREMGKTFMQFKSFMFAATQRMLIAGLQGQDHNYIGGTLAATALGMMSYAFKQWDAGREITDDPKTMIVEGLDRSGSLGALMEINNTIEKISGNNFGLRPVLGVSAPASRYASRSFSEAALGPTFGSFMNGVVRTANASTDGREWDDSDTRALRRLLPYQNLSIVRQGLDKIEESIGD